MFREKGLPMVYGGMVFLLSACATVANGGDEAVDTVRGAERFAEDERLGERVDRMCFTSSIDGFSDAEDDTIVLRASASRHYLVETTSCHNLDWAQSVAIDSHSSCATRGDRLIVYDTAFPTHSNDGLRTQRCLITGIYEWDPDAGEETEEASD